MTPKKVPTAGDKGKNKVEVEDEVAPKINFLDIQYPEGVLVGKEWDFHICKCKISDYNHRTSDNKKDLDVLLSMKTNKRIAEDMLVYDDTGEKLL
ncbi:hypothetical protein KI387_032804, partial [Taxus chinensis]